MNDRLKDTIFSGDFYEQLSADIKSHYPIFDKKHFLEQIFDENREERELKERMRHTTLCLKDNIPLSFEKSIELFKKVSDGKEGFGYSIFPDFVEIYGIKKPEISFDALAYFTEKASSEFAIRPFILKYEKLAMSKMEEWAESDNFHIRRLASAGCRPRLPWAMALPSFKNDPSLVLPILEKLKNDPKEYVRRSVANNLNDISKDNPETVIAIAKKWLGNNENTDKLVKRACRSLLKSGNTEVMMLFGFENPIKIQIDNLSLSQEKVSIGEDVFFRFEIHNKSNSPAKLRLEYKVDFVKKSGKTSPKIFAITEKLFPPGITKIKRKHSFKNRTTRKHYRGKHVFRFFVNGVEKGDSSITLCAPL